jgi:zinc transporter 9
MSLSLLAGAVFALSMIAGLAPRMAQHRLSDERLQDLTGIAAGLLLASAILIVIPEGFHVSAGAVDDDGHVEHVDEEAHHEEEDHDDHDDDEAALFADEPVILGAAVLAGFGLMLLLEGLGVGHDVHEEHHDHEEGHGHGHVHHPNRLSVLSIGLTIHALADGLAIGAAAVAGETAFTVLVALAVVLHRVPAAFSLGVFALHETAHPRRALSWVLAFAIATPLAMLGSFLLLDDASERLVSLALLFSAGTFVYVATVDTLPSLHNPETGRRSAALVLLGALVFAVVFIGVDSAGWLEHSH